MRLSLPSIAAIAIIVGACADLPTGPGGSGSEQPDLPVASTATSGSTEPQLLVCPTAETQSARGIIGPLGGRIGAAGSSITIPMGAVLIPTVFEVIVPASSYMEVEIHAVGFEDYRFALLPATVTIDYSRCPADAVPSDAALHGVHIDDSNSVVERMGGDADPDRRTIKFLTGHLSGYAVAF